jgi:hypothetical protein
MGALEICALGICFRQAQGILDLEARQGIWTSLKAGLDEPSDHRVDTQLQNRER